MEWPLYQSLIDQLAEHPPDVLRLHGSGESTAHKEFARFGEYARQRLPNTFLQMNTGGLLWTTDEKRKAWLAVGIDKLTFSIEANRWLQDGLDAEGKPWDTKIPRDQVRFEYKKYVIHPHRAGAPWNVVIPNIVRTAALLNAMKAGNPQDHPVQRVRLFIQHVVTREQEIIHVKERMPDGRERLRPSSWEIEFSRAFWAEHGVEVQYVPVATVGGLVDNSDMANEEYMREPMGTCREVYTNFVIGWDGKVSPCCVNEHTFSLLPTVDLSRMSIEEAWNAPALSRLREIHREHSATGNATALPKECAACLAGK